VRELACFGSRLDADHPVPRAPEGLEDPAAAAADLAHIEGPFAELPTHPGRVDLGSSDAPADEAIPEPPEQASRSGLIEAGRG
jgi:hypothetical protein